MENIKILELEILITISQNSKIPVNRFHKMFDYKWRIYRQRFYELKNERVFQIYTLREGLYCYELSPSGKKRIAALLDEREKEIEYRLTQLDQTKIPAGIPVWEKLIRKLNSLTHNPAESAEKQNTVAESDYARLRRNYLPGLPE